MNKILKSIFMLCFTSFLLYIVTAHLTFYTNTTLKTKAKQRYCLKTCNLYTKLIIPLEKEEFFKKDVSINSKVRDLIFSKNNDQKIPLCPLNGTLIWSGQNKIVFCSIHGSTETPVSTDEIIKKHVPFTEKIPQITTIIMFYVLLIIFIRRIIKTYRIIKNFLHN